MPYEQLLEPIVERGTPNNLKLPHNLKARRPSDPPLYLQDYPRKRPPLPSRAEPTKVSYIYQANIHGKPEENHIVQPAREGTSDGIEETKGDVREAMS